MNLCQIGTLKNKGITFVVFSYLTIGQLLFVYPARRIVAKVKLNTFLLYAILVGIGLQISALTVPSLGRLLNVTQLNSQLFSIIVISCFISWLLGEGYSRLYKYYY